MTRPGYTHFDHLVIAMPYLAEGVDEFAQRFGVRPLLGGTHKGLGTANYLVGLEDDDGVCGYLEILGPDLTQVHAAGAPWNLDIDKVTSPRLHTWAVRPDDFDETVRTAAAAGVDLGTVESSSRITNAGDRLSWRLTSRRPMAHEGSLPFLIDWMTSPHPSQADLQFLRLEDFAVLAPDPAEHTRRLEALGLQIEAVGANKYGLRAALTGPTGTHEIEG